MSHCRDHLTNHVKFTDLKTDSTLYVIGVISNPARYQSRYRIAREWIAHMEATKNVQLVLVESAFADRCHEVTDPGNPFHVQLVSKSEIWTKESMINLGVRRLLGLVPDARYIAWVDADVFFRDPNWALETIHQLQYFQVVQPWSDCADLGPQGNIFQHFKSFGHQHQKRIPKQKWPAQPYPYAHSGFAWACTRSFWEQVAGLMDFAILGSADHHMAFAMIGEVQDTIHGKMGDAFRRRCMEWQLRAARASRLEVGCVMGRVEHWFHGPKKRRYYRERWQILIDHAYDPDQDLTYDEQGLIKLIDKPALEHDIHTYNRSRLEDSIEET